MKTGIYTDNIYIATRDEKRILELNEIISDTILFKHRLMSCITKRDVLDLIMQSKRSNEKWYVSADTNEYTIFTSDTFTNRPVHMVIYKYCKTSPLSTVSTDELLKELMLRGYRMDINKTSEQ